MNHSNTLTGKNSYKIHMSIHWIRLQSSFIKKKKKSFMIYEKAYLFQPSLYAYKL